MLGLFHVLLGHLERLQVHVDDSLESFLIESRLSLLQVLVLLVSHVGVSWHLGNPLELALNEDLLSNLFKVFLLQILDPDHLGVNHQVLVELHLLSKVISAWSEVEDQLEILAHSPQEVMIELIPLIRITLNLVSHILRYVQVEHLRVLSTTLLLCLLLLVDTLERPVRPLLLHLDGDKSLLDV